MMPVDTPPVIIQITQDFGGTTGERAAVVGWLKRSGARVGIIGTCGSSCYWLLALPKDKVCVSPGAWFAYHSHVGEPDDKIKWERGHDVIARLKVTECGR